MADPRDDRALLAAHVAGEPDAFDELVRRHVDRLWRFAVRTLEHHEDAADAVQDALISAFRSAAAYRGESEVSTWLHRIVLNACRDRLRRRRLRAAESLAPWHDRPAARGGVDEQLTRMAVDEALDTLPTSQRLAVVLVDMQGFSIAETAELLGVREGTVKSRCARGRLRLAKALRHLHPPVRGGGNPAGPPDVEPGRPPADGRRDQDRSGEGRERR